MHKNVFGHALKPCCDTPTTGFTRTGYCEVIESDFGNHSVCAVVTKEFLEFTKSKGNDLSSPMPQHGFKGLNPGDHWCLCASRWQEALEANAAPPVILESTHQSALDVVKLEDLQANVFKEVEK